MIFSTVYLAAEDTPGLAVGRKLISENPPLTVYREFNGRGFGNLKCKSQNFQQMARSGFPVLMFTDLDRNACPTNLISKWLTEDLHPNFLFRICVREVEAWLFGHRDAFAAVLGIPASRIPDKPEQNEDPKRELIKLAQRAPRRIRDAVTPIGTASIGPGYNELLVDFIERQWNPEIAAQRCPSLDRARSRIADLANRIRS